MTSKLIAERLVARRFVASRYTAAIAFAALVCITPPPAMAQTSTSGALVRDNASSSNGCSPSPQTGLATTSVTCLPVAVAGGVGSASATSSNAARTATVSAALQAGPGGSTSALADAVTWQYGALTVSGTPAPGDQLVYHFLTNQSALATGGSHQGAASWDFALSSGSSVASVDHVVYGDGTQGSTGAQTGTPTAQGFDLVLPFVPSGSTFNYEFFTLVRAYFGAPVPAGESVNASFAAMLQGVDAETANGTYISSATFDPRTGLGTISATSATLTTPEPSMAVLMSTGLVGLLPTVRRRKR